MTPNEITAANVRRLRKARGWSQAELARQWGVSVTVVVNSEAAAGRRKPRIISVNDVVALAGVFGVPVTDLISMSRCPVCEGAPPRGLSCRTCGAEGGPAGGGS